MASDAKNTNKFAKGNPGKPKGAVNKTTRQAREAIAMLVEANLDEMQGWLSAIAEDEKQGPAVAFKLLMDVMEYHIPKLARTELTGADGGALTVQVVRFADDPTT